MKELICPQRLIANLCERSNGKTIELEDVMKIIDEQRLLPSVPATPNTVVVTRCSECKHYRPFDDEFYDCGDCGYFKVQVLAGDYCSLGEEKQWHLSAKTN